MAKSSSSSSAAATPAPKLPKNNDVHKKSEGELLPPKIVDRETWLEQRRALLAAEKDVSRAYDAMVRQRRELGWTPILKSYEVEDVDGKTTTLNELVAEAGDSTKNGGGKAVVVQHFMYPAKWETGCSLCSLSAETIEGHYWQLSERCEFIVVMHAPSTEKFREFVAMKKWPFRSYNLKDYSFGEDFGVAQKLENSGKDLNPGYNFAISAPGPWGPTVNELPAVFVFASKNNQMHLVNAVMARGLESLCSFWSMLDLLPGGRQGYRPRHREVIMQDIGVKSKKLKRNLNDD